MAATDPAIRRAEEPRPPALSSAARKVAAEHELYVRDREGLERRSVWRGLILLALAALIFSFARAGLERTFYTGWWRQW